MTHIDELVEINRQLRLSNSRLCRMLIFVSVVLLCYSLVNLVWRL